MTRLLSTSGIILSVITATCRNNHNIPPGAESEIKGFSTFTDDLIKPRDWLIKADCPVVAM
jgi:hypothetical protein